MEISAIKGGGVLCLMGNAIKNVHIFFEPFPNKTVLSTDTKHVNEQTLKPTSRNLPSLIIYRQVLKPSTKMYVICPIKQGQRVLYSYLIFVTRATRILV